MELATAFGTAKSGGVIVAAIAAVFTIGYVANMLGEDEDWLHDLSIDMFPEDGCLHVYGRRRRWCDCLHPVRHRVLEANHRRRQRAAARQADGIAYPAVLTACLRSAGASTIRGGGVSNKSGCGNIRRFIINASFTGDLFPPPRVRG
jgi:hypothetical protein